MKKNLEWLKEEVGKNTLVDAADIDRFPSELVGHVEIKTLYELIDQVEQPETLSQEWINDHKVARISNLRKMTMSDVVPVERLEGLLMEAVEQPGVLNKTWINTYSTNAKNIKELADDEDRFVPVDELHRVEIEQPALPVMPDYVAGDYERLQGYGGVDLAALNYWTRNSALQCTEKSHTWLLDQDMETIANLLRGQFTVEEKKLTAKDVIEQHIEHLKTKKEAINLKPYYDLLKELEE